MLTIYHTTLRHKLHYLYLYNKNYLCIFIIHYNNYEKASWTEHLLLPEICWKNIWYLSLSSIGDAIKA